MSETMNEVARDAVVLATGVVLVTSTIWLPVGENTGVAGAILILGMLAAGTALWAMSSASRSSHWAHLTLGVMLALAPVVLDFPAGLMVADMFALIGGIVIAAMGLLGVLAQKSHAVGSHAVGSHTAGSHTAGSRAPRTAAMARARAAR